jgi:RluA family pseudouridine synthase
MARPTTSAADRLPGASSREAASTWVTLEHVGRLDRAMRRLFPQWPRAEIEAAIGQRRVKINGRTVWMSSWEVVRGDRIDVSDPPADKAAGPTEFDPSWLVEDLGDLLVVDKPAGLRSEAVRAADPTANLLALARVAYGDDLVLAHRLDRDTSGLVLLTRPGAVRTALATAFSTHTVEKRYVAVVRAPNDLEDQGVIRTRLAKHPKRADHMVVVERGGDLAMTRYRVVDLRAKSARVDLWPETGRTHQLRVHCASMNAPIVGDVIYGAAEEPRLLLHATELNLPALGPLPPSSFISAPTF